jgi:hypothetical protein
MLIEVFLTGRHALAYLRGQGRIFITCRRGARGRGAL